MATLSAEQIYQACLEAGFTPDQSVTWTAIALAESGGNTAAHNPSGEDSWGLWQINIDPAVRSNPWGDLTDPVNNARAAYEISNGGTNMRPWTVTHASNQGQSNDYRQYMDEARAAAGGQYAGDFSGVSGYDDPNPMGADEPPFTPAPGGVAPAPGPAVAPPAPANTGQDTDSDGALDAFEMSSGTDPENPDSDSDGLTDGFELLHGLDPNAKDSDSDGLSDGREVELGTNPVEADTDADGMNDAMEVAGGRDPLHGVATTPPTEGEPAEGDTGGGAETNAIDGTPGSNGSDGSAPSPGGSNVDTDDDGLSDGWEASLGTDPTQADSDDDGLDDALEQAGGTDPLTADSDHDGILDGIDVGDGIDDIPVAPDLEPLPVVDNPAPAPAPAPPLPAAMPAVGTEAPPLPAAPGTPNDPAAAGGGTAQQFLDAALAQAGDSYVFGAEAENADVDPETFDCSELVQWAAAQAGVEVSDGSWVQYNELEAQGQVIPVEEAINTPGALLFSFSSDPGAGGRPSQAHVAISLGDGRTIEARGTEYGVGTWEATTDRFEYAAVIPGLSGGAAVPTDDALGGLPQFPAAAPAPAAPLDSDQDGVTDVFEMSSGTNPLLGDSDADGLTDGFEVMTGSNAIDGMVVDSDGDGLSDALEAQAGTTASAVDSDGDGLSDALEMAAGRNARFGVAQADQAALTGTGTALLDADSDGLSNAWESSLGSDATMTDSDRDGLSDALELARGTDTDDPDTDDDGYTDGLDEDD